MADPALLTPVLAQIHAACFTTPRPWDAAEIDSLLTSPHVFLLSRAQGFLLGRALAGEAEVLTLAVAPAARRQGLGRALLAGFLTHAAAAGADSAFLEVSAENPAAIALYESAGFVKAGQRRRYYHTPEGRAVDAWVLTRAL